MKPIITLITLLFTLLTFNISAQTVNPVKWDVSSQELGNNEFMLFFVANVEEGWYIYSKDIESTPPLPTSIVFHEDESFQLTNEIFENGKAIENYDEVFEKKIRKYKNKVTFQAVVKINAAQANATGFIEYMTCNDRTCLPPVVQEFNLNLETTVISTTITKATIDEDSDYTVHTSKNYADDEYVNIDKNINIAAPNPVDVNEMQQLRYGASRSSAPAAPQIERTQSVEEFHNVAATNTTASTNDDKTVDLENSTDLMVAANALHFLKKKKSKAKKVKKKVNTSKTNNQTAFLNKNNKKSSITPAIPNPVKWTFRLEPIEGNIYNMIFEANVEEGWHIYGQNSIDNTPAPLTFKFDDNSDITFLEDAVLPLNTPTSVEDKLFSKATSQFNGVSTFTRKVAINENVKITGSVKYMAATDVRYLMPKQVQFSFNNEQLLSIAQPSSNKGWIAWVIGLVLLFGATYILVIKK